MQKPRVNSEPIQGSETDKPKRHTSPKYPVQECHQLSSNADEVALVDCSLNATSLGMLSMDDQLVIHVKTSVRERHKKPPSLSMVPNSM